MNNQLPSLQVVNAQLIHQTLSQSSKKAVTCLNRDREDAGSTCLASFLTSQLPGLEQVRLIQVAEPQQCCLSRTEDLYGIRFSH